MATLSAGRRKCRIGSTLGLFLLAVSFTTSVGTAREKDVNVSVRITDPGAGVERVGWKEGKADWRDAGEGSELRLSFAPGNHHLTVTLYDSRDPQHKDDTLSVTLNGSELGTFTRGQTTGWSTWRTHIPKEACAASGKQVLRFVRAGNLIAVREVQISSSLPPQDPDLAKAEVSGRLWRAGWNSHVKQRFMHPPQFSFTAVENASLYRCSVIWKGSESTASVKSDTPTVDLGGIWHKLPHAGRFEVLTEALDAEGALLGHTRFAITRIAPFQGPYRPKKLGYRESGVKAAKWVLKESKDDKAGKFPALFQSAYIRILTTFAKLHPDDEHAAEALDVAKKHGHSLIQGSTPPDWAYANMPMSHDRSLLQICRAGMVGMAYLDLFAVTGDKVFRDAAMRIADTLKQKQLQDGRWYFRVEPKSGKVQSDYTSDQAEAILLLDELIRNHAREDLAEAKERAVTWMLENPCKTYHWQQQWDDVGTNLPYRALEWFDTGLFIEYLLRYATPENEYERIAESLLRYIDDQFVEWEPAGDYVTPGVREQYVCYHVIDWHCAHYIRVCMAFYAHTSNKTYLEKAKAMADTLTAIQHPEGYYPTWMSHSPTAEDLTSLRNIDYSRNWANCTSYTGEMLMKLEE